MKNYFRFLSYLIIVILLVLAGCNNDDDVISNDILVAAAGDDRLAKVNDEIILDGTASFAKDDGPFTYNWSILTKPQGSLTSFENPANAKPTLIPDKPGIYKIQLRIQRNNLSDTDELKLMVSEKDPEGPATIILEEGILENTILNDIFEDPTQPDYRVTADIDVLADLVIMPGVTVVFEANTGFEIISGSLQASGLENKRITFKGVTDQPGFWKGIVIHTNSDDNKFEYVTIQDGGSSAIALTTRKANLSLLGTDISGAAVRISHTSFSGSGGYGLYLHGMSSLNHFENNFFASNAEGAAYIPAGQLHKLDLHSFLDINNNLQAVETGGVVLPAGEFTWKKLPYLVSTDVSIGSGISIEAGAYFSFAEGTSMNVLYNGYLHAIGADASQITFRSADPNKHWKGLSINSHNNQNVIAFGEISNGGYSKIADADHEGNIVVGLNGLLKIENSLIKNSLGYGIVTKQIGNINANVISSNVFFNLQKGSIFPEPVEETVPVNGVWLDQWSFNQDAVDIVDNLYNRNTGTWFGGAENPWAMTGASFGIRIEENGAFSWTIAEHSPMTGCESYSAEFITGQASISNSTITFQQDYWRSKFVNKCDESQNVDTDVTPTEFVLPYTITKMYNVLTGEQYWELKIRNPDNSTFSFYRR